MRKAKKPSKIKKAALVIFAGVFFFLACLNFPRSPQISAFAQTPYPQNITKTPEKELLLSRFTTYFDGENIPRSHNIRLACRKINGCKIGSGAEFSFNQTVGARTKERGFLDALVIFEGQFTSGTGGGVCQVSSTLYNAVLLAGLKVIESHPHSLQVSYVPPSLDAMVSVYSDLKFLNSTIAPVAVFMYTGKNSVTAEIYGKNTGYTYQTESITLCALPPPSPEILEGEEDCILRQEKSGLKSESYLVSYRNGKRIKSVRIRRDKYAFVQGIQQKKSVDVLPNKEIQTIESCIFNSFGKVM